jgi:thiamine-phosphate pyrophosphorylase
MLLRKRLLWRAKLYLILDRQVNDYDRLFEIAGESLEWVDIVQLRDKKGCARDILSFSRKILKMLKGRIPFIINDRVDLAMSSGADGVHLGQEDIPIQEARQIIGDKAIIGLSCQTYEHARQAERDGADYIGFGSVFKTLTKPGRCAMELELLRRVVRDVQIPVFAIGGITPKRISKLRVIGVERFAVCRAVCDARNIEEAVREIKACLDRQEAGNMRG